MAKNERSLFEAALALTDASDREAFLDKACQSDTDLRARVDALLKSHIAAGSFLDVPAVGPLAGISPDVTENTILGAPGENDDEDLQAGEVDLSFLEPSKKPGSIGTLGHYEILQLLGHGGFGIVLKAFDEKLHRLVAIKVMNVQMAATSPPRKRFLREARSAAAIKHENIVQVYSVEEQPLPYIVMEFVDGETLEKSLNSHGPLDAPEVLYLARQMANGLAAAHAMGLIHRDIKPGNILLENGVHPKVKITDFGLARAADDASLTQSGMISGTPMYMAPEQALGQPMDQRTDLFSLGSVLYRMACGRPPFRASNTLAVLRRVTEDTPRALQEILPQIPDWLVVIINRLLAKKPEERFQTSQELADLLARCESELQSKGQVTCVSAPQRSQHSPSDDCDSSALPSSSRPSDHQLTSPSAVVPSSAVPQGSSRRSETATLDRTRLIAASIVGIVALVAFLMFKEWNNSNDPASGGRQPSELSAEISNSKSEISNMNTGWHGWPTDAPDPAIAPFDAEQATRHQEEWAAYLKVPVEYTNSIGMKFRLIPPGEFLMGSTQREIDETISRLIPDDKTGPAFCQSENPQHKVVLTKPFYVGIYEVTQEQYESVLGTNPSQFSANGPRKDAVAGMETGVFPVELVQWRDAADFCAKLSAKEKLQPCYFKSGLEVTVLEGRNGYCFPTEAQWEFACRAGTTTKYWNGDTDEGLVQIGWFHRNSGDRTHAVGELNANPFGLYDVHGNVREYCQDWFDEEFYKMFQDKEAIDPLGPTRIPTSDHLVRGGGAQNNPTICRSASRHTAGAVGGHVHTGFRVWLPVDAVRHGNNSSKFSTDSNRERDAAWWALTMGGEVSVEVDGATKTLTSVDQLPTQDFSVVGVYVHRRHKAFPAESLEKLVGLPRLHVLRLAECPTGDAMTEPIGRLTRLLHLQLQSCQMTDAGLERLQNLSKLEYLDLNHQPGITDRGLAVVRGMPRLTELNLTGASISDQGLQSLRELPLAHLNLDGTKVTDVGLKSLASLKSLTHLYLAWCAVSDDGLAQLQSLEKLHTLSLSRRLLTDRGFEHLSAMQSLRNLHIGDTKVTADDVASLQKKLPNCKITADLSPPGSTEPTPVVTVPSVSAWDLLDPAQIPEAERIADQPKELIAVLGEHRQRHAWGGVTSIAIRPDGKQFVTVARDGLRFWDATTFQQTSHFRPTGYSRLSAAYISQGKQLVVGNEGLGGGQIWNLDEKGISSDAPVALPAGTGTGYTNLMVVSPNEKWLIRRTEPNSEKFHLSLITLSSSQRDIVAEYPGCRFAAFSPDNRLLAVLHEDDKTIRILELGDGVPLERHVLKAEMEAQDDRPAKGFQQLVFLADGRLATADNNGRTWFWNLQGDQPQILFSTRRADQFLHAATQAPIVVTAESGVSSILRIDADQAVLKHHATWTEFGRPESNLTSFAIFPDGRTAITGHLHGAIRFWDITGEKAVEKHPIALQPSASPYLDLAMFPGVIVTRDEQNSLRLWKPTADGLVEHSATRTEEPQKYLPVTTSLDGSLLVTIWGGPGCTLWQWNGETLSQLLSVGREGSSSAALSSDNRRLAIGYRGTVDLWDITARPPRLEKTLKATDPNAAAYQTAFAKDDTLLIASMNNQKTVWNLTQDKPLPEKLIANQDQFLFTLSPTRNLLAIDGGGTQLLSLQQFPPQHVLTLKSAPAQFGAMAFSSDGKQLAVTDDLSVDRSIIDVHDTETGVRKHRITLPMPLRRMAFTEDNRHLVTVNSNGTIYVLRLEQAPGVVAHSDKSNTTKGWHGWPADAPPPAIAPFNAAQAKQHQEAWARYLSVPVEFTNIRGIKFVLVPPGEFLMGTSIEEAELYVKRHGYAAPEGGIEAMRSESPQHKVILTQPFYLSTCEVTRGQFEGIDAQPIAGDNAAKQQDDEQLPAGVSWNAVARFCNQLGQQEGLDPIYQDLVDIVSPSDGKFGYRLPTEAEWEFACRAGTQTRYWTGDDTADMVKVEWRGNNSDGKLHPVGQRLANPFGLHDMHGNIREWCQDAYTPDAYTKRAATPAIDPLTNFARISLPAVMRGGDFGGNNDWDGRGAVRLPVKRDNPGPGFRLRLSIDAVRHLYPRRIVQSVLAMNGYVDGELDGRTIHIAEEDADQLQRRGDLKVLAISLRGGPRTTNEGMIQIANLPDLRHLSLTGFELSDEGLESLGVYPQLRSLYLEAGHRTPRSLELIGRWSQLEHLSHIVAFSGKELSGLENLQELQTLRISDLVMTDDQTRTLSRLPKLKFIWLGGEQLNDDTLRNVARLPALTAFTVTLAEKSRITNEGARALAANPRIISVNLDSTRVDDQGLAFLAERKNWEEFLLDGTQITDSGLAVLKDMQALRTLWLSRTSVGDPGLEVISSLSSLEVLYLNETQISDAGLKHLEALQLLKELHLDGTRVSPEAVTRLQMALPKCRISAERLQPQ